MSNIKQIHGNIFATNCDTIVNTVNCVGVMGAGIALECSYRFTGLEKAYKKACDAGDIQIGGKLFLYTDSKPRILCLPTKKHWKLPSKIDYIHKSLETFSNSYIDLGISSIAMPHLGCSHGGLNWETEVEGVVLDYLEPLNNLDIEIYSFDPNANDPLFDQLIEYLNESNINDIAIEMGIKKQYAEKLLLEIQDDYLNSMFELQKIKGIGKSTLRKIYDFLAKDKEVNLFTSD